MTEQEAEETVENNPTLAVHAQALEFGHPLSSTEAAHIAEAAIAASGLRHSSRVVEAAPSDTDREALLAKWDDTVRPAGWNAGDEHHLATLVIDALRASQPVQVESGFVPTHRVRERGSEAWIDVRADGVEPQTYYDRDGKTIYAGIWFRNMEVERASQPVQVTDDMVERAAKAINLEGWTFEGEHEPGEYCNDCRDVCLPLARAALSAALGGGDHAE